MVRLNDEMQQYIKQLAVKLFNSSDVWIFGSRANLDAKGGDIDIYIETTKGTGILKSKIAFLSKIETAFGFQKIDLLIDNHKKNEAIFNIAKNKGTKI